MTSTLSRALARLGDGRTDADLVHAFRTQADHDAFAALVRRHGPLVLGVCRRSLGATPDADDAFQATFLVLVRRAADVRWRESIAPWLYGVAVRVARKARQQQQRRTRIEQQVFAMTEPSRPPTEPDDAAAVLDEELAKLPEAYRRALVLCELQGLSRKAAAGALKLSEGTLSSRLARGRKLLRDRLVRRGVTAGAVAAATVPESLIAATMQGVAGTVPAAVMSLMDGVVKTMFLTTKLKLTAVVVAAGVGLTGLGVWSAGGPGSTAKAEEPKPRPKPPAVMSPPPLPQPQKPDDAVATIFGDEKLTMEQFGQFLVQRHRHEDLQKFVNLSIVQRVFGKKGWTIKAAEVQAAIDADLKATGKTWPEYRENIVKCGHTDEGWMRDVIEPRIMLAKLTKSEMLGVTEDELKAYFEEKHGEYRLCHQVLVRDEEGAKAFHAAVKSAPAKFEEETAKVIGVERKAVPPPVRLSKTLISPQNEVWSGVHRVAAGLKAGEISDVVKLRSDYWLVLYCKEVVAGDADKTFTEEKAKLHAELMEMKLNAAIPKVFNDLKKAANPQYHLFPTPVLPQPVERVRYEVAPAKPAVK